MEMRVLLGNIRRFPLRIRQQRRQIHVPRYKGQVGIGDLVPDQIWRALFLQVPVNDASHALHLVTVALDGRGDALFWVEEAEPGFLAEIGALAGDLEVQPAKGGVFFFGAVVVEIAGFVVVVDEVFDDGTGLGEVGQ